MVLLIQFAWAKTQVKNRNLEIKQSLKQEKKDHR